MQGPPGELRALAPCIQDLDLADNLLPDWSEAARLAQELPELASLDLSLNRMAWPPARPALDAVAPFMRLETLVVNQCCLSWQEVSPIACCGLCCTNSVTFAWSPELPIALRTCHCQSRQSKLA